MYGGLSILAVLLGLLIIVRALFACQQGRGRAPLTGPAADEIEMCSPPSAASPGGWHSVSCCKVQEG